LAKAGTAVIVSVCSGDKTDALALAAEAVAIGPDVNDIDIIRLPFDKGLSALDETSD
jgi:hypothetical protein